MNAQSVENARTELEEALQGRLRPWRWREYRGTRFTALVVARRIASAEALWTVTDTEHAALLVTHAGEGTPWVFLVDHPAGVAAVRALANPRTPVAVLVALSADLDGAQDTEMTVGAVATPGQGRCNTLETPQPDNTPTREEPPMDTLDFPTRCDDCPEGECDEMRHGGTMCAEEECGMYSLGPNEDHDCPAVAA